MCFLEVKYKLCLCVCEISGGFSIKRKDFGVAFGKKVQCSAQPPPPAWPGRAFPELSRKNWDGPKPISVVGSTGSIGTQVIKRTSMQAIYKQLLLPYLNDRI